MTATHEKIAKAVKYAAFDTKRSPAVVADVNFYLNKDDRISQERLDEFHATAARLVVGQPEAEFLPEHGN